MIRRKVMILSTLLVLAAASTAQAQEILLEGPLAGAPACRSCVLHREGRFTVAPLFLFSLLDDYRRHISLGLRMQYNITDWLALSISGGYSGFWGDVLDTGLTEEVANKAPNGIQTNRANYPFDVSANGGQAAKEHTTELLGRIMGFVSAEVVFVPLRGKFGLFSRLFLDVDLYVFAGYAFAFVNERKPVDCRDNSIRSADRPGGIPNYVDSTEAFNARCPWVGSAPAGETSVAQVPRDSTRLAAGAGTYGVGVSIYFNDWLALTLEYRLMPIKWNHTGTDERGMDLENDELTFCPNDDGAAVTCSRTGEFPDRRINESDRTWTLNHNFGLGLTFHFPFSPRHSD